MFRHGTYYIIANDSDKTLETIVINYANTIGFHYNGAFNKRATLSFCL